MHETKPRIDFAKLWEEQRKQADKELVREIGVGEQVMPDNPRDRHRELIDPNDLND
jgi:hypothetical protein